VDEGVRRSAPLGFLSALLLNSLQRVIAVTIVRVGSNEKYANGWDQVFGGKTAAKKGPAKKGPAKKAAAKPAKKAAKKKAKK
jgi:hypothetical protein